MGSNQIWNTFFKCLLAALLFAESTASVNALPVRTQRPMRQTPLPARTVSTVPADQDDLLARPAIGYHKLRIITPTVLELSLVTTKKPDIPVEQWDFAGEDGTARLPSARQFQVSVAGKAAVVSAVGFKRRVLYAPLRQRDLRIGNYLYLRLKTPVPEGAAVEVTNPDGTLWASGIQYSARADRSRINPAIHVNQVGYMPEYGKKAMVGYYLGSLGELDISHTSHFSLIENKTGKAIYSGELKPRLDKGWTYPTLPYQHVLEADFSGYRTPGEYRLCVPGLGTSLPFRINEGTAAAFARTYALGLYHQRCGAENALPFTRFVH